MQTVDAMATCNSAQYSAINSMIEKPECPVNLHLVLLPPRLYNSGRGSCAAAEEGPVARRPVCNSFSQTCLSNSNARRARIIGVAQKGPTGISKFRPSSHQKGSTILFIVRFSRLIIAVGTVYVTTRLRLE